MNIKLIIERIENGQAVLKTEDGQNIIWPTNKLPESAAEGTILNISINNKEQTNKQLAKDILNEILDTNH